MALKVFEMMLSSRFGESCTNASDCNPLNSECINNVCACNSSDVKTETGCLLPVGARCRHRPCDADNSECLGGICICKPGFIQAYNNTFCFKTPKYDDFCEKDHDCLALGEGGRCSSERCRCSFTTAIDDNMCKKKIDELGARCNKDTEVCYLERNGDNQRVECKEGVCTCKGKHKPSADNLSCGAGTLEALSLAASFITLLLAKAMA
ncbi:Putative spliceosomal complex [Gryllus bimaculatus]|nr:Putative spliceosomal complex [Gryllus bimaculatus]